MQKRGKEKVRPKLTLAICYCFVIFLGTSNIERDGSATNDEQS